MIKISGKLIVKLVLVSLALTIMMALGGCSSVNYVWYQPGKDVGAFRQDHLQCEEQSAQYARYTDKRGNKDVIFERMKECMGLRGYVRTEASELPEGVKEFK